MPKYGIVCVCGFRNETVNVDETPARPKVIEEVATGFAAMMKNDVVTMGPIPKSGGFLLEVLRRVGVDEIYVRRCCDIEMLCEYIREVGPVGPKSNKHYIPSSYVRSKPSAE